MSEPLIEDDEFWQGVVDATDCILTGRVIEAICTALERRAAPDEASRAPAPISEQGDDARDAARYRWLREHNPLDDFSVVFGTPIGSSKETKRQALDKAIDAKLRKGADHGITPATEGAKP